MQCDLITLVKTFTNIVSSFSIIFTLFASSKSHYIWLHIISTLFCLDLSYNPNFYLGKLFYFGNGTHQLIAFIEILFNDIHIHNSIQSEHVFTSQTSFQIVGTPNIPNSQSENLSLEGLGNAPFLSSHISTWIGVFDLG